MSLTISQCALSGHINAFNSHSQLGFLFCSNGANFLCPCFELCWCCCRAHSPFLMRRKQQLCICESAFVSCFLHPRCPRCVTVFCFVVWSGGRNMKDVALQFWNSKCFICAVIINPWPWIKLKSSWTSLSQVWWHCHCCGPWNTLIANVVRFHNNFALQEANLSQSSPSDPCPTSHHPCNASGARHISTDKCHFKAQLACCCFKNHENQWLLWNQPPKLCAVHMTATCAIWQCTTEHLPQINATVESFVCLCVCATCWCWFESALRKKQLNQCQLVRAKLTNAVCFSLNSAWFKLGTLETTIALKVRFLNITWRTPAWLWIWSIFNVLLRKWTWPLLEAHLIYCVFVHPVSTPKIDVARALDRLPVSFAEFFFSLAIAVPKFMPTTAVATTTSSRPR